MRRSRCDLPDPELPCTSSRVASSSCTSIRTPCPVLSVPISMLVFTLAALSVARVNDNRAAFRTVRFLLERRVNLQPVRPELVEARSEEHTSELQSLMRISYAVFCLNKKKI